jgi:hypothetical protein
MLSCASVILDMDRGHAGVFKGRHRLPGIEAAFSVGDHRNAHRPRDGARLLH